VVCVVWWGGMGVQRGDGDGDGDGGACLFFCWAVHWMMSEGGRDAPTRLDSTRGIQMARSAVD